MSASSAFAGSGLRDGLKKRVCNATVSEVVLEVAPFAYLNRREADHLCLWRNVSLR